MDYLVGIDLGSTSLKAVVYDLSGKVMASASRPTERFHPNPEHPEWTVWKPEQIWGGTADALREAVGKLDNPSHIKGVAVTGMGMDGVPVDADGQWLYPFISWLDNRTTPQLEWWKANIGAEKAFTIDGSPLWAINSAMRILWMKEHEPAILARTDKWLLIEDFLNFMLCGRRATDYSMAFCTLLFDQRTLSWSDEMLRLSGIDRRLMPEALPSGTLLGKVTAAASKSTGLPEGTPVVLGGHDHLCGALPVGAFKPGIILEVTGTWEFVSTTTTKPVLTPTVHQAGLAFQAHVARGMHCAWGSVPAAESLEWFRNQCCLRQQGETKGTEDWASLIAAAAKSAPGAGGVFYLPHLSGSTCPVVDPAARGSFVGLRSMTTRGDMFRAIIEGLNYQFLDMLNSFENALGIQAERIIAIGGATRNEFWMQNKADLLGKTIEVPAIEEATPLGAAIVAGIGVGLYKNEQEAYDRIYKPGRVYKPNSALADTYAKGFEVYRQLYPALSGVHRQIASL